MPIKDRLASLKKKSVTVGEAHELSELIIKTAEEESTDEFLRKAAGLREAIGEMEEALELIRQLHSLLKVSTDNPDRARLRLLFDELTRVFKQFSQELDQVVRAVNDLYDEVRAIKDQKSAYYRMKKDQTESLRTTLHEVVLRFRNEEVPFEQETKPATEKQLREFQMKPSSGLVVQRVLAKQNADESSDRLMSPGREIGDVEKASEPNPADQDDRNSTSSLKVVEINEETDMSDEKATLMEVKQRNEDLLLLEKAVSTLNSLHEHLNFLVHAGNPILDRIDANISQAVEYTAKVMDDTKEAVKLNQQAREKSILVFFLLAMVIFILLFTIITVTKVWIIGVV